jgi:hypothetical protein
MEELKKLEEITSPDSRTLGFVLINRETGQKRALRIEALHEEVEFITLDEKVPEEVRSQFNVARNLCLYSWFCYAFHNVACLKAYTTIELALRLRLGKAEGASTLTTMLKEAVSKGFLKDKMLPEAIAGLRNYAAHGSPMNGPWSVMVLHRSAETLNELFAETQENP